MHWQRGYCILVAEDWLGAGIVGYVDIGPEPDLQTGWLWHLVVERSFRRQGVGGMLLRAALQWSGDHQLRRLMAPLQTKTTPAFASSSVTASPSAASTIAISAMAAWRSSLDVSSGREVNWQREDR